MERIKKTTLPLPAFLFKKQAVFFIFIGLIFFTMISWWGTKSAVKRVAQTRLELQTAALSSRIIAQLEKTGSALYAVRAHFENFKIKNSQEFSNFIQASNFLNSIPGLEAIAFSQSYSGNQQAQEIIATQKKQGYTNYKIWPQTDQKIKTAITLIYPQTDRNKKALGYDMYSELSRRSAMDKSLASNDATMSQVVRLVQEGMSANPQPGLLVYLPFIDANTQKLKGFFYAVIRAEDFVKSTLSSFFSKSNLFDFSISLDTKSADGFDVLFSQLDNPTDQSISVAQNKISILGQTIKIQSWYHEDDFNHLERNAANFVLTFGLLITMLVTFVVFSYQRYASRESELIAKAYDFAEKAKAANMSKTAFLANMSHEIRTPLGAIMGYSEMLSDKNLSPSDKESIVQNIKSNGEILTKLLEDILDSSKIEAGKLSVDLKPTHFQNMIEQVQSVMQVKAKVKNINLIFEEKQAVPDFILTDDVRVIQILTNLISNAIRFTDIGYVKMTYGQFQQKDKKKIFFEVEDSGVGISKDAAEKLFTYFGQGDVSTTRKYGGTGLGLALSKNLARLLGGDVFLVKSMLKKGSTFRAEIDLIPDLNAKTKTAAQPIQQDKKEIRLDHAKILLVEDSPDNQEIFRYFIESAGGSMELAADGKVALEKGQKPFWDIILMDVQIPYKDGREVTRELRALGVKTPIIALTAHAQKEEVQACLDAGCDGHISKPVEKNLLIEAIYKYKIKKESLHNYKEKLTIDS